MNSICGLSNDWHWPALVLSLPVLPVLDGYPWKETNINVKLAEFYDEIRLKTAVVQEA